MGLLLLEFISNLILFIFGTGCLVFSVNLGRESTREFLIGPAVYPAFLSCVIILLTVIWFVDLFRGKSAKAIFEQIGKIKVRLENSRDLVVKRIIILLSSIIYIFVLPYLGFRIATFLFLTGAVIYFGEVKKIYGLLLGVVFSLGIYYFFNSVLSLPLP